MSTIISIRYDAILKLCLTLGINPELWLWSKLHWHIIWYQNACYEPYIFYWLTLYHDMRGHKRHEVSRDSNWASRYDCSEIWHNIIWFASCLNIAIVADFIIQSTIKLYEFNFEIHGGELDSGEDWIIKMNVIDEMLKFGNALSGNAALSVNKLVQVICTILR